ncbi:MAG: hypothetical protein ACM3MK_06460 [Chitinophagales bacterium]
MSRLLQGDLKADKNQYQEPGRIWYKARWLQVEIILDRWHDCGCWWDGESPKLFFRLQLEGEKVWEVFEDLSDYTWHLYKIYD